MVIHHLRSGMILHGRRKTRLSSEKKKKTIPVGQPSPTLGVGSPWWGFNMVSPGFNPRSVGGTKGRTKNLDSRDQAAIIQSFWWQNHQFWWRYIPWICDGSETRLPHEAVPTRRSTHCPTSHRNSPRYPAVIKHGNWKSPYKWSFWFGESTINGGFSSKPCLMTQIKFGGSTTSQFPLYTFECFQDPSELISLKIQQAPRHPIDS